MKYNAMKLYRSIDFLEAVEVLIELQSKTRHYLSKGIDRQTRKENRKTRKSHKKLFGCTKYNNK